MIDVRVLDKSSEEEMVACFLLGELTSERFGARIRAALAATGLSEQLLTEPDLRDDVANEARSRLLGATRGYRQNRDVFDEAFPGSIRWIRAELDPSELMQVRYIEYSYWHELSGGSRLAADAARRIADGVRAFDVPNDRFLSAAQALRRGEQFPPLILVGARTDALVCLEGNLRLTAHAVGGFSVRVECLVGTAPSMNRWSRLPNLAAGS
jgi:hypothetical protein